MPEGHPSVPLISLPKFVELDKPVLEWEHGGNTAFKKQRYLKAVKWEAVLRYILNGAYVVRPQSSQRYETAKNDAIEALKETLTALNHSTMLRKPHRAGTVSRNDAGRQSQG